jgi:hypothetical protein
MPSNSDLNRLAAMGEEAEHHAGWADYAAFANCRSRGLRSDGFRALDSFIVVSGSWSFEGRLAFCRWLFGPLPNFSDQRLALPQPLLAKIAIPTVKEWSAREPNCAEAHLWLGLLHCDVPREHLARALELDPTCDRARWTLVEWIIGDVEYNQHHLPDFYIHDPRDDLPVLNQAEALIDGGGDDERADCLRREVSELRCRAEDWVAAHPREGDFAAH